MQSHTPAGIDSLTKAMRAMVYTSYGRPGDVLALREVPVPAVEADQVLVRVRATAINALDWRLITGTPYIARIGGLRSPARNIPGADIAGNVVAIGANVTTFAIGDEVFGGIDGGGFAEYVAVRESNLAHRPANLNLQQSSTLGVAALTALQGLRDWGGLQSGQSVLINGASGGVGTFAVQIARALGASQITAVCSTRHIETVKSIGADRVIDYTNEDFTQTAGRHDLLFDNGGMNTASECRRVLVDGGTHVMVTGPMNGVFGPLPRMMGSAVTYLFNSRRFVGGKTARSTTEDLITLKRLVEEGAVSPVMDRLWKLDEAVAALEYQGEGHARGKSIIEVSE